MLMSVTITYFLKKNHVKHRYQNTTYIMFLKSFKNFFFLILDFPKRSMEQFEFQLSYEYHIITIKDYLDILCPCTKKELGHLVDFLYNGEIQYENEIDSMEIKENLSKIFGFSKILWQLFIRYRHSRSDKNRDNS